MWGCHARRLCIRIGCGGVHIRYRRGRTAMVLRKNPGGEDMALVVMIRMQGWMVLAKVLVWVRNPSSRISLSREKMDQFRALRRNLNLCRRVMLPAHHIFLLAESSQTLLMMLRPHQRYPPVYEQRSCKLYKRLSLTSRRPLSQCPQRLYTQCTFFPHELSRVQLPHPCTLNIPRS